MRFLTKNWPYKVILGLSLLCIGFLFHSSPVSAACTQATDFGTVTFSNNVSVPATGSYRVWSRIQIPSTANNGYMLEIDGTCYNVGGSATAVTPNTWTWVDYQGGTTTNKINASLTAGTHTVRMLGTSDGVLLDRVIFAQDTACVPSGTGDNCANPADTTPPTTSITAPANNATVNGTVSVTASASDDSGTVSKVEFYVNGALKATDTASPYTFSWVTTTGYPDGSYALTTKAYDAASNVTTSSTVNVTVHNATAQKAGDANNDGKVDSLDFATLIFNYNKTGTTFAQGDFNNDGKVDSLDFAILIFNYGK